MLRRVYTYLALKTFSPMLNITSYEYNDMQNIYFFLVSWNLLFVGASKSLEVFPIPKTHEVSSHYKLGTLGT